jgi:anthranilate phosphoribosyltransferase
MAEEGSKILKTAIARLMEGKDLSRDESRLVMTEIMYNHATEAQISAYLVSLRMKGETVDEITGSVEALVEKQLAIELKYKNIVDTCGTGGDNLSTFNISTAAALLCAGAGIAVAKHGHRSVSSKCGSADLLKAVGVNIEISRKKIFDCLNKIGIAFIFAQKFQQSWRFANGPRREIGARTLFNILGPLTNPARIKRQVIGVYDPSIMLTLAKVMKELGSEQVMIVHGEDGLDEISITGKSRIVELLNNEITEYIISPEDFRIESAPLNSIQSSSCEENIRYLDNILAGKNSPAMNVVILNAAAAIKVSGKVESLADGINLAKESAYSGAAKQKFERLIEITNNIN